MDAKDQIAYSFEPNNNPNMSFNNQHEENKEHYEEDQKLCQ